jgi:hypothetical protein
MIRNRKDISTADIPFLPCTDEYCEEYLKRARANDSVIYSSVIEARTRRQAVNKFFYSIPYSEAIIYEWCVKRID